MQNILIHTLTPPALSLQGKNNTCVSAAFRHTHIHTSQYGQTHTQAATVTQRGGHQEALCAIEGLEDSGYLEHDGARLRVVHPLGAVQRILQHVFKRCTQTQSDTGKKYITQNQQHLKCLKKPSCSVKILSFCLGSTFEYFHTHLVQVILP